MGCCLKVIGIVSVLSAIGIGLLWQYLNEIPQIPDFKLEYWAAGPPKPEDKTIRPFKINFPESALKDLEMRLNNTRTLTKSLEGIGFQYGFNTNYLNKILKFWKTEYKWKEREPFLNKFPHFKTQISGLDIHFMHVKPSDSKGKTVLPMLIMHGWPGSIREFYDLIPLLTTPKADNNFVFEVVAPSLPGYGFSDGAGRPGLGPAQIGVIFNELMGRLGFDKYYIQGGDWGSIIGHSMAILYPNRVLAYHSNMCFSSSLKAKMQNLVSHFFPSLFISEDRIEEYRNEFSNIMLETGYFHLQATKPDTVGIGLNDSPAGLAAYILEKFSTWTNKAWRNLEDGGLEKYDKVALLDNVMIYWLTGSITTSVRLYSESFSRNYRALKMDEIPVTVPTSCARFPHELMYISDVVLRSSFLDLVQVTDFPKGGHFAAFEVPDILADDVWKFMKKLRDRGKKQKQNENK
uniref:Epoxide hydrolase n=1 Tax=Triatoma dimidiata TaxID=72491 RepID=A0A0V0G516_TRIDM